MSRIGKPERRPNLPAGGPEPTALPMEPSILFRQVAEEILRDDLASASDKLRAAEVYSRLIPQDSPTIEQLTREETANMSDAQLDELLGFLTHPLNACDPREVEREVESSRRKLQAEFDQRVDARVRELVDVDAVNARIEARAREIAEQGGPLVPAPTSPPPESRKTHEAQRHTLDWPPDRPRQRTRLLGQ